MAAWHDPTVLPEDLPAPVDDGAADHLGGMPVPHVSLASTGGDAIDIAEIADALVLYVYPRTGRPDEAIPEGWDAIPGARGCTPQACAFRDRFAGFAELGYSVAGLSAQSPEEQLETRERLHIPFHLLADPELRLAQALRLPTFAFGGVTLYKRLTLIAREGRILKVFYPVFPPDENAEQVLTWIQDRGLTSAP